VDASGKAILWRQFGASLDMLENALRACPEALWRDRSQQPEFSYAVFHALFWLDLYLSGAAEGFAPPAPFTLDELDPAGLLPERAYGKDELQAYLDHGREKCRSTIAALTAEMAGAPCRFAWGEVSFAELLVYNLRHVQHHAAQLNLILRQQTASAPGWVTRTARGLGDD
jgi:hypothetical protein